MSGTRVAPSPCEGEGWDGGQSVKYKPQVFEVLTPTPTLPLQGGGSKS
jgi:hypothetical protein